MSAREASAKRWCFTINNPTDDDKFWENGEQQEHLEYLIVQEEIGENGTRHYQGFLILKRKNRLTWLKSNINNRAHWEKTRGTDKQAADYCRKDDTHPDGGLRFEFGQLKAEGKRRGRETNWKRQSSLKSKTLRKASRQQQTSTHKYLQDLVSLQLTTH